MITSPLKIKEIEEIASNFRKQFNINEDQFFPILEVLDMLFENKLLSIQFLEDDNEIFDDNTPAIYNAIENYIYIKESVIDEYESGIYRACFTLAHELFHYIQVKILNFEFVDEISDVSYKDPEWQANEFAGQLLIPTKYINLDNETLISKFHVSEECITVRKLYYKRRNKSKKNESLHQDS